MATKATSAAEIADNREETGDGPLLDNAGQSIKKLIAKGKERGYITIDELNAALPQEKTANEQIEDVMSALSEMGINVVENEDSEEVAGAEPEREGEVRPAGNLDDDDIGRTDDPVRMYLREMGSVELLSREGEIAIAKRIEAGREMMIGGICESPLTIRAIIEWHNALKDGKMLLRDIIDLDATYGGGPDGASNANANANTNANVGPAVAADAATDPGSAPAVDGSAPAAAGETVVAIGGERK
ncbi:MAG: RNA polymerase sigma factor RpoD, partial [Inquilinus sp.]|nr:RNA polymerase sigma factor RpoD [Inquilinus sp.]